MAKNKTYRIEFTPKTSPYRKLWTLYLLIDDVVYNTIIDIDYTKALTMGTEFINGKM